MIRRAVAYGRRILIAIDQLFNALADGSEDETISSRVGKAALQGKRWALILETIIDRLLGRGHCRRAIEWDEAEQ